MITIADKTIAEKLITRFGSPELAVIGLNHTIEVLEEMKINDTGQMSSFHEWTANSIMDQQIDVRIEMMKILKEQILNKKS